MKEKIKNVFLDRTDLDMANQEIGYLKDLCDAKDQTIAYQKELLNVQSESLKQYRLLEEELNNLKESLNKKKKGGKSGI